MLNGIYCSILLTGVKVFLAMSIYPKNLGSIRRLRRLTQIFKALLTSIASPKRLEGNTKIACCLIGGNLRNLRTTEFFRFIIEYLFGDLFCQKPSQAKPSQAKPDSDSLRARVTALQLLKPHQYRAYMASRRRQYESHGAAQDDFNEFLRNLSAPIFGGVFSALIANCNRLGHGNIVLGLKAPRDVYVVSSPFGSELNYDEILTQTILIKTFAHVFGSNCANIGASVETLLDIPL